MDRYHEVLVLYLGAPEANPKKFAAQADELGRLLS